MSQEENHAVVLFDGVCNFCNNSINFIIRHDKRDYFRYAPLQSPLGQKMLGEHGLDKKEITSVILFENGKLYTKTSAALRIAKKLNAGWPLFFYLFIWIPPFIRNVVYDIIARNRYRWWGKKDSCMIPSPDVRKKFLDTV